MSLNIAATWVNCERRGVGRVGQGREGKERGRGREGGQGGGRRGRGMIKVTQEVMRSERVIEEEEEEKEEEDEYL